MKKYKLVSGPNTTVRDVLLNLYMVCGSEVVIDKCVLNKPMKGMITFHVKYKETHSV